MHIILTCISRVSAHKKATFSGSLPGADPGFQVRGAHLKKIAASGGRREIVGVFRMKNHDFMQKNHIFSNFRGGARAGCPPFGSAPKFLLR